MHERRKDILWFIILRLIIVTSLGISAVSIQYGTSTLLQLMTPLVYFIVIVYFLSLVYFLLFYLGKYYKFQLSLQIFFDLVLITFMVYFSGGLRGSFYYLYIFVIIAASIVINRRAAYLTAALSSVFLGILANGLYHKIIPYFGPILPEEMTLAFVLNQISIAWVIFFLVAFLINYLTGGLKRAQDQLTLAQRELEIKNRLAVAGEFSAQIAHEIRNPLAAISGSIQVLREEIQLTGEQKKLMDIVVDESKRVSNSIDQFLSLAASGKEIFRWIDLSKTLQETVVLLQRGGNLNSEIKLEGNYNTAGISYFGNRNQFKQIFWNLIKNGLKAMGDGGILSLDLEKKDGGEVVMRFSDTGLGMQKQEKDRLFEPFFSGFKNGQGIGMAVVHRIVDEYNGKIEVISEPNIGTTINIILPPSQNPAE